MDDVYTIGCHRHHVNLEGQPKLEVRPQTPAIRFWKFDLSEMYCPASNGENDCRSAWRVGRG